MKLEEPSGIAFVSDAHGVVRTILRDGIQLGARLAAGENFVSCLEAASRSKWQHFIEASTREKATFNWQMDVLLDEGIATLDFAAAEADGVLIVVAAPTSDDASHQMYEQLLSISNEQSTTLRDALKRLSMVRSATPAPAPRLWEEQTRINNELVNLQRELARRNAELARLNEQKNQLLGVAAHDLRNPISSVRLYCDVMLTSALDERQRRSMTRIRALCDFMVKMVDDLLDLSSIQSGRLVLEREDVDITALMQSVLDINRDLASVKRIKVHLLLEIGDTTTVSIDPFRFEQVLNNLLSNAVKYSHPDTAVTVVVRNDGAFLVIAVRDQGQGIPSGELDRLFKPFVRTSTRATAGETSTGLGLAIVDRIVRAHGGTISVTSAVGVGTTFEVRLPSAPPPISVPRG